MSRDYTDSDEYKRLLIAIGEEHEEAVDCVLSLYGMNEETYDNICYYFVGENYDQLVGEDDE